MAKKPHEQAHEQAHEEEKVHGPPQTGMKTAKPHESVSGGNALDPKAQEQSQKLPEMQQSLIDAGPPGRVTKEAQEEFEREQQAGKEAVANAERDAADRKA